ncbi:hypothetical protein BKA62DRAFT_825724 [Auriculariales sp. MPI-PUGE-AT-0066]|nr:hypothetical protein BKA62DRAFT_825724 [Auriculariales sp. MPI-PUGE-AT-0066]
MAQVQAPIFSFAPSSSCRTSPSRSKRRPPAVRKGAPTKLPAAPTTPAALDARFDALTNATMHLNLASNPSTASLGTGTALMSLPVEILSHIAEYLAYDSVRGWDGKAIRPFALTCSHVLAAVKGLTRVLQVDNRLNVPGRTSPTVESMAQVRRMRVTMTRINGFGHVLDTVALCSSFVVHVDILNVTQELLEEILPRVRTLPALRHLNVSSRKTIDTAAYRKITANTLLEFLMRCPSLERLAYDNIDEEEFTLRPDEETSLCLQLIGLTASFGPLSFHLCTASRDTLEKLRFVSYTIMGKQLPQMSVLQQITFDTFSRTAYTQSILMRTPALKVLDLVCVPRQMPSFAPFPFTLDELHMRWIHIDDDPLWKFKRLHLELECKPLSALTKLRIACRAGAGMYHCPTDLTALCNFRGIVLEIGSNGKR